MFVFLNNEDRKHKEIYADSNIPSEKIYPIFDLTEKQTCDARNSDWLNIKSGNLVLIIGGSYKASNIYIVHDIQEARDEKQEKQLVLRGKLIAKFIIEQHIHTLFSKYKVKHIRLPDYHFCMGFNVADIEHQLDMLEVRTTFGTETATYLTITSLKNRIRASIDG